MCVKFSGKQFPLRILVKKSDELITFNSHMHIRQSGRSKILKDTKSIRNIITQSSVSPPSDPFEERESFQYRSSITFSEAVEVVYIAPDEFDNTSFLNDFNESLLSLPNMSSGGYLIIGLENNSTVLGVILQQEENAFSNLIGDFLQRDDFGNHRVWEREGRLPRRGKDWSIKFIPVTGGPAEEQRSLIIVHLKHCQGGVWANFPENFMISEDGCVYEMTFVSWKSTTTRQLAVATMARSPAESERDDQYSDQLITMKPQNNIILDSSQSNRGSTKRSGSVMGHGEIKHDDKHVENILKIQGYLSFTEHSSIHGKGNLKEATTDLLLNADKFAKESHVLTLDNPMTVTPARNIIISHHAGQEKEITAAIKHIEAAQGSKTRSFCLVTSNWNRDTRSQMEVERAPGHLFDVLVIDENGHIRIRTIVNETVEGYHRNQTRIYTLVSGRKTKRSLLLNQPYFVSSSSEYIPSVWIEGQVFETKNNKEFFGTHDTTLPSYFNSTMNHLEGIKLALSMLMLNMSTTIKSVYGDELNFTLTSEQLKIIRHIGLSKFTFVEGPPGSGKTRLALYICINYSKCGYICTTETFKKYLIYQGLPEHCTFYTDKENVIKRQIKDGDFTKFEYLIYDDVHNSPFSEKVWRKMFKSVRMSDKTKLVLIGDTRYQNFMETSDRRTVLDYTQKFCQRSKHTKLLELYLSDFHRTTKTVTSFISSNFEQDADIACSSNEEGEDVLIKVLSNIWSAESANGLVNYVKDLVGPGEIIHNEPRDIVILVDIVEETECRRKNPERLRELFKCSIGDSIDVHDAGTFPVTGLTIDTLNNFMGFDRKVCILVSEEKIQTTCQTNGHSFENSKYKAFVASRGISKVVFVVEKELSSSLASKFHCNNITDSTPPCLWTKTMADVHDVCWLRMDQTAALLYTSASGVSLVSLEGDNLDVTIDTSGIKLHHRVACNTSGQTIVVTDGKTPHSWTVYHRQDSRRYDREATHDIDGCPASVTLTSDGDVLMEVGERSDRHLRRYRAADGRLVWETSVISSGDRGDLTLDSSDRAYVCTWTSVAVYSPGGELIRTIHTPDDLPEITAVCADSSGRRLFTGHGRGSVALLRDGKLVRQKLIEMGGTFVWKLCLYKDTYLVMNTSRTLHLFNVKNVM